MEEKKRGQKKAKTQKKKISEGGIGPQKEKTKKLGPFGLFSNTARFGRTGR